MLLYALLASLLSITVIFVYFVRSKNIHIWGVQYIFQSLTKAKSKQKPIHIMFCFVDHYEPRWHNASIDVERQRVQKWCDIYPQLAGKHKDADGHYPKHSFFYPEEEYREEHINNLKQLCDAGYGEIEIHLHHNDDTSDGFRQKIQYFRDLLAKKHGCLSVNKEGKVSFGFVHGDWALDNSHPDGNNCGVNDELIILREEGCYADFTLPSAPHPTQTRTINSIYMAKDDPVAPKSHDRGELLSTARKAQGDLLIVQGPLTLNWQERKWHFLPRIENSDVRGNQPPTEQRVDLWVNQAISVVGREEWIFIKIHTHGTQDNDIGALLGKPVDDMFYYLENKYNDGTNYMLHYVTAREMVNIIRAAEDGKQGNPNDYRDYVYTNIVK